MEQLALETDRPTMAIAREWARRNPEAWAFMQAFAADMCSRGRRFGMKALAERVRWELAYSPREVPYKLNNSLVAALARLLIEADPRLEDFIETRKSVFDS